VENTGVLSFTHSTDGVFVNLAAPNIRSACDHRDRKQRLKVVKSLYEKLSQLVDRGQCLSSKH